MKAPDCYCGEPMVQRRGRYGPFYGCSTYPECDGAIGMHPDGSPVGIPAPKATRQARIRAHNAFDALWKPLGKETRGAAYRLLAEKLDVSDPHIGDMTEDQALMVAEVCEGMGPEDLEEHIQIEELGYV